jgi:glucokinase
VILAGDIGGTKSNLGLFDFTNGKLTKVVDARYVSHQYASLGEIIQDFLAKHPAKITGASFGVAGPVVNNAIHNPANLAWGVDGNALAKQLGLARLRILNDLEATGYGTLTLEPNELEELYKGTPGAEANRAVIAAGTGLGEAILFWDGQRYLVMATEGGHADFAPHTDQQIELLKFIRTKHPLVSIELILSGRGFPTIHQFLDPSVKHEGFDDPAHDPAPLITQQGLSGECPVCVKTLELWTEIYGSEAGNLAVRSVARGGVYVAGGIAVKILPKLKAGSFVVAFREKEKMGDFLTQVPINVILNEECPLQGAAYVASKGL